MEKGEAFRCLMKGVYCKVCENRVHCHDIEIVTAKQAFEKALFDEIIARSKQQDERSI